MVARVETVRMAPVAVVVLGCLLTAGCSPAAQLEPGQTPSTGPQSGVPSSAALPSRTATPRPLAGPFRNPLPGMPRPLGANVYAGIAPGRLDPRVRHDPAYLYVPNSYGAGITTVIDQRTHRVVRVLRTGQLSQHATPSYDLRTIYVEASYSNRIVAVDPRTGRIRHRYPVDRPYNLYFTPDGRHAIVMDEEHQRIVVTDPHDFTRQKVIEDPTCRGPNHADFSANGQFFLVSCEFSGSLLKISTRPQQVVGRLDLGPGAKPQDVRLAPDGRSFFVADMDRNRLLEIDAHRLRITNQWTLPAMPHGIYPSRDGQLLYISDRMAGAVSVFSLARRRVVDTWHIPGGGTPDMGGLSADGLTLWLSGRFSGYVYGWNTRTGRLVAKIWVGGSPHGLLVWPQPGRYSLGHTGNLR
jgi:DNA-binding beta-propeller fold protein YncE